MKHRRAFAHPTQPRPPASQKWKSPSDQAGGRVVPGAGDGSDLTTHAGEPYQEIGTESTMRMEPEIAKGPEARTDDKQRSTERELVELRKEVVEARNLVIKTDNLLKNLFAELKVVSKKNDEQFKRTWFASAAAYGIFLLLAGLVSFLGARASVSSERAKVSAAEMQAEQAKKTAFEATEQLAKLKGALDQSKAASDQAFVAFKLMSESEGDKRSKGIDELAKVDRQKLTALEQLSLDDRARSLKGELAKAAFEKGRTLFRRQDMKSAAAELRRFLALDPDGADSALANFYLGNSLYQLKDFEGAAQHLEKFTSRTRGKNVDYALFLLGQSDEQLGRFDKAAEAYRRGVSEYPASEFLPQMQARLRTSQRVQGGPAAAPAPAPATATTGLPAVQPAHPTAAAPAPAPAARPVAGAPAPAAAPAQPAQAARQ